MLKSLLKYGLILLAAILVYNLFFGTAEEKAQSKEVFRQTGKTIGAAWNLLKSEKEKFDAGKYDNVLDKLGDAYRAVRNQAKNLDEKVIKRLDDLERRKAAIEQELGAIDAEDQKVNSGTSAKAADQKRRKENLQRELDSLIRDTEALLKDAEK